MRDTNKNFNANVVNRHSLLDNTIVYSPSSSVICALIIVNSYLDIKISKVALIFMLIILVEGRQDVENWLVV